MGLNRNQNHGLEGGFAASGEDLGCAAVRVWERERYWCSAPSHGLLAAVITTTGVPREGTAALEVRLGGAAGAWLQDLHLAGRRCVPPAALLEAMAAAARALSHGGGGRGGGRGSPALVLHKLALAGAVPLAPVAAGTLLVRHYSASSEIRIELGKGDVAATARVQAVLSRGTPLSEHRANTSAAPLSRVGEVCPAHESTKLNPSGAGSPSAEATVPIPASCARRLGACLLALGGAAFAPAGGYGNAATSHGSTLECTLWRAAAAPQATPSQGYGLHPTLLDTCLSVAGGWGEVSRWGEGGGSPAVVAALDAFFAPPGNPATAPNGVTGAAGPSDGPRVHDPTRRTAAILAVVAGVEIRGARFAPVRPLPSGGYPADLSVLGEDAEEGAVRSASKGGSGVSGSGDGVIKQENLTVNPKVTS
eukprot:1195441-Prorocentrum_minimum.AAC.3